MLLTKRPVEGGRQAVGDEGRATGATKDEGGRRPRISQQARSCLRRDDATGE